VFKTIIWATDGSASAEKALPVATGLVQTLGGRLVIAHIEEVTIGHAGAPMRAGDEAQQAALNDQIRKAEDAGVPFEFRSARAAAGDAASAIVHIAEDVGADLVVAGSRGRGPLAGLILGSVALRLLQTASCPVLIVPERAS
jgi:nucleotide-binding universal stress UspA family protein